MRFLYEYRTADNAIRRDEIRAADRDAAFAALKARGIRPARMTEAPGVLNKIFGKGKRWLAIVVLGIIVVFAVVENLRRDVTAVPQVLVSSFDSPTRRQVIGDAEVIARGIRTGWADVFELEGDRFLASFAIPGVPAGQRSTTEEKLREALDNKPSKHPNLPNIQTSLEARQIRAMVEGMKEELRQFLADGGTIAEYGAELVKRQEREVEYYQRAKREIEGAYRARKSYGDVERLLRDRNARLRKMGIRLVVLDEEMSGQEK